MFDLNPEVGVMVDQLDSWNDEAVEADALATLRAQAAEHAAAELVKLAALRRCVKAAGGVA